MEFNVAEYENLLKDEFPEYDFSIMEDGLYKNGEGEIYTANVVPLKYKDEDFPSFSMILNYFDFTEEQQKENFIKVAKLTIDARKKYLEGLLEQRNKKTS